MELQHYLDIFRRRFLVIVLTTSMAVLIVTTAGFFITPVYKAYVTVRVLLDVGVTDFRLYEDYSRRLLNTYKEIIKSDPVLKEAIARVKAQGTGSMTLSDLRENLTVEVVPDTELISIAVQAPEEPSVAVAFADVLAKLLIEYGQNLYVGGSKSNLDILNDQLTDLESEIAADRQKIVEYSMDRTKTSEVATLEQQIKFKEDSYNRLLESYEQARLNNSLRANSIVIVSPATLPKEPTNTIGLTYVALSVLVGGFSGICAALVLENLDTRILSPQQLERLTNKPVLGVVPSGLLTPTDFGYTDGASIRQPIEEAYRLLAVNLPALKGIVSVQTILITSAVSREGKSTVAVNLAQIFADRGQSVYLVEADMRRPTIVKKLGLEGDEREGLGLSGLLAGTFRFDGESLESFAKPAGMSELFVIGGGAEVPKPTLLLASSLMEELLGDLVAQGHNVLLDAPPVLGVADVSVLAPKVEGVILVARQEYSKREHVLGALRQLQSIGANVLGFVFVQKGEGWRAYD